jgi:hypothetical protein
VIDSDSARNVVTNLHGSTQRINNGPLASPRSQRLASQDLPHPQELIGRRVSRSDHTHNYGSIGPPAEPGPDPRCCSPLPGTRFGPVPSRAGR